VTTHLPGEVTAMLRLHHAVLAAVRRGRPQAAHRAMKRLLEATRDATNESSGDAAGTQRGSRANGRVH
jgi:DNA-binding FadR family transcriptional regulator